MNLKRELDQADMIEIIRLGIEKKFGQKVKSVSFQVTADCDGHDRPTGGHTVGCTVEVVEAPAR